MQVVTMNAEQFGAWKALADRTSYKQFAENVPGGKELLDKALSVEVTAHPLQSRAASGPRRAMDSPRPGGAAGASQACGIRGRRAAGGRDRVVVCQMVVMRYASRRLDRLADRVRDLLPIVASTFIGAPYVLLHKGHVHVDLVPLLREAPHPRGAGAARFAGLARLLHGGRLVRRRIPARGLGRRLAHRDGVGAAAVDPAAVAAARHGRCCRCSTSPTFCLSRHRA
ncbi:MAG: hypothetical protein MZV65_19225 [Chromatiales bacterium]|nr:hypothetical protein [Chromatiales bacterium]